MGAGVACTCGRRGIPRHASLDGCTAASRARAPWRLGSGLRLRSGSHTSLHGTRSTIDSRDWDSGLFSFQKFCKIFSDSLSHRIFRRIYKVLNIDENKN